MTSQAVWITWLVWISFLITSMSLYSGTLIEGTLCRELFGRGHIWGWYWDSLSHFDFHIYRYLRSIMLGLACSIGVQSCIDNGTQYFKDWMNIGQP